MLSRCSGSRDVCAPCHASTYCVFSRAFASKVSATHVKDATHLTELAYAVKACLKRPRNEVCTSPGFQDVHSGLAQH